MCGECSPGAFCPECADAHARVRKIATIRRSVLLSLGLATLFYAAPPLISDLLRIHRGQGSDPGMYLFMAMYAGPTLFATILVWITKRFWVALFSAPPLVLGLGFGLAMRDIVARVFLFAGCFVLFALVRSVQGWRAGRTRQSVTPEGEREPPSPTAGPESAA
jgi:hypothetical protein